MVTIYMFTHYGDLLFAFDIKLLCIYECASLKAGATVDTKYILCNLIVTTSSKNTILTFGYFDSHN